jgi:hypothetical protein
VVNLSSQGNPTNMEVVLNHDYGQQRCKIASISNATNSHVVIQTPCWTVFVNYAIAFAYDSLSVLPLPSFLENAYELLVGCGAGCWYLNRVTSTLYYKPRGGETMNTTAVVAPQLQQLVTGVAAHDITFSRLRFAHATWLVPDAALGFPELQHGVYCNDVTGSCGSTDVPLHLLSPGGALDFSGVGTCKNITFDHNLFTHLSALALLFQHGCQNPTVTANVFADNAGGPIQHGDVMDRTESVSANQSSGLLFQNNTIDGSFEYPGSSDIFMVYTKNDTVSNNEMTLTNGGIFGIGSCFGFPGGASYCNNNNVTNNKIVSTCQGWRDCGAIYYSGVPAGGVTVSGNYIQHSNPLSFGGCLYLDTNATGLSFTGNVCDDVTNFAWIAFTGNTLTGNFVTNTTIGGTQGATGNTVNSNTSFTSGSPPAGATTIINAAKVQAGVTPGP